MYENIFEVPTGRRIQQRCVMDDGTDCTLRVTTTETVGFVNGLLRRLCVDVEFISPFRKGMKEIWLGHDRLKERQLESRKAEKRA